MSRLALPSRTGAAYAEQMRALLPQGAAWDFAPDGPMAALIAALAEEFGRIDLRGLDLIEEMDPRTTLELLPDWERVAELPDTCTGAPDTAAERQAALHQKLTRVGAQNRAAYVEMAARVGYAIRIEEHRTMRAGFRCGDRCNGLTWSHVWTVYIRPFDGYLEETSFLAVFRAGSRAGDRLRGWGALDLECLIRRAAPAHTQVLFAYEVEPAPAFWAEFTL